jgi:hypothetical protein
MEKTSALPTSRAARRSFTTVSLLLVAATAAGVTASCGNAEPGGQVSNNGALTTAPLTPGAPSVSGTVAPGPGLVPVGVSPNGTSPVAPVAPGVPVAPVTTDPTAPVTPGVPAGTVPGNTGTPATTTDPTGPAPEECVDREPPPDPEWPDATCQDWATTTEECAEAWFANYCDVSCGRCVPASGMPQPTPEPEPCEDREPPPDPEWPDATCEDWATTTEECAEAWFADYCDVSCGRCVPEGGIPEPEPEKCEDVEPPPNEEWPGATCAEWANESEECGADWFQDYCAVSCGRCIPEGGIPEPTPAVDCSGEGLPNVTGGEGFATRYWDCCQPHCAQQTGHKCGQDGVTRTGDQTSSCNGGGSFACYDEAPRAVSDCLSYGHIAKANPQCGACYRIQFTGEGYHNASDPGSQAIRGKQMVVKVSNTGSDVAGNQFDLMVPGGGVGMFNACSRQWNAQNQPADYLGAQYGGFLTNCTGSHAQKKDCVREGCQKIPAGSARDGCLWFVDWLEVADNPKFTSQQTDCPF